MTDLLIQMNVADPNFGDFYLVDGDLAGVPNQNTGIQQHIMQRLRTFQGEWFLDNTVGIPYYQQILVKAPNQGTVNGLFISEILATPGVTALTKYSFQVNAARRKIASQFRVQTTTGQVDYSGTLL